MRQIITKILIFLALIPTMALQTACSAEEAPSGNDAQTPDESASIRVTSIDVGKGDCILIRTAATCVMIDTGYYDTTDTVLSYLEAEGISRIDHLIITHYDKDHVGGAYGIADALNIGRIYLPDYDGDSSYYVSFMSIIEEKNLTSQRVSSEISVDLEDAQLNISPSGCEYHFDPEKNEPNDNDMSLVCTLIHGEDSFLFVGDLEKEGLDEYLKNPQGHFDVVKMPHHGQNEKNTDDFIADVTPKIAIITDSADDPVKKKVLNQLTEAGTDIYSSSECGNITITGDGLGNYEVLKGKK